MKVGRGYIITWLDHRDGENSDQAWHEIDAMHSPAVVLRSLCYVVKLTRTEVLIAHTMEGGQSTTPFTIVRKAILSAEEVPMGPIEYPVKPKARKR